ncbi:ribonuclease H-like domain-containing protein [Tanacetum coccineum]
MINISLIAKQTREPFPLSDHKSLSVGDLVHLDLWGPYMVVSRDGYKYFLTVVDDYSKAVWVYLIKSKDEVSFYVESFVELINTQFNKRLKVFRSDNGTEFVNNRPQQMEVRPYIWEARGGNTRDLDSIWKETGRDYNFTRSGFKDARTVPGDGVAERTKESMIRWSGRLKPQDSHIVERE